MKYAYVNLLYDDNDYFYYNLLCIISLNHTKPNKKIDKILLFTSDIPIYKVDLLREYYNEVIKIDYIKSQSENKSHFKDIFTKLQIFELDDYDKILYLDSNLIVNKNIDHLFELKPPAGVIDINFKNKKIINDGYYTSNHKILNLIKNISKVEYSNKVEMIYLTDFYKGKWNILENKYNYSVSSKTNEKLNNIYIIHYNSKINPIKYINHTKNIKNNKLILFWIKYYKIVEKVYKKKFNIILDDLRGSMLNNIDVYIKNKFKNCKTFNLSNTQLKKLNEKMDEIIIDSSKSGNNYTYRSIINYLIQNNVQVLLYGGCIRNLYNDQKINDIDCSYHCTKEEFMKVLDKNKDIIYSQGFAYKKHFDIGEGENKLDFNNIDNVITPYGNSPINMLIYDYKNNIVYDTTGIGVKDILNNIFRKPPNLKYEVWLKNNIINRLYKFIKLGYKTNKSDKIKIYNDLLFKNHQFIFYRTIQKTIKENPDFWEVIGQDIDSLNLNYNSDKFKKILKNKFRNMYASKTY